MVDKDAEDCYFWNFKLKSIIGDNVLWYIAEKLKVYINFEYFLDHSSSSVRQSSSAVALNFTILFLIVHKKFTVSHFDGFTFRAPSSFRKLLTL